MSQSLCKYACKFCQRIVNTDKISNMYCKICRKPMNLLYTSLETPEKPIEKQKDINVNVSMGTKSKPRFRVEDGKIWLTDGIKDGINDIQHKISSI